MSLKIYAVRGLVDTLFNLGLCISYDRLLKLILGITNGICQHFKVEDTVCLPKLCHGLSTTGAVDNTDHNPRLATSAYFTEISLGDQMDIMVCNMGNTIVLLPSSIC